MKKLLVLVFFSIFMFSTLSLSADPRLRGFWVCDNMYNILSVEDDFGRIRGEELQLQGDYIIRGNAIIVTPDFVPASEVANLIGWEQLTMGRLDPRMSPSAREVFGDARVGRVTSRHLIIIRNNMLADGYSVTQVNTMGMLIGLLFEPVHIPFSFISDDILLIEGIRFYRYQGE